MIKERILKMLKLDSLIDSLSGYVESRFELFKIEIKEDVVRMIVQVLVLLIIAICAIFVLLLLTLGGVYYLGSLLGMLAGAMIMAGLYLLILIVLISFRKRISNALHRMILQMAEKSN